MKTEVLSVRVNADLLATIDRAAAARGWNRNKEVADALGKAYHRVIRSESEPGPAQTAAVEKPKVKRVETPPEVVESIPLKVAAAVVEQKKTKDEPGGKPCPKCGRVTIAWGPSTVRCVACVQNFAA